jgi:basic membrane protein A and related proteins
MPHAGRLISATVVAALLLAAASTPAAAQLKVALVLAGSITDQGPNQLSYEGLMKAKERYGVTVAHSEKVKQADQAQTIEDYARRNYDIVIAAGGEFVEATKRAAQRHKNTKFVCINCAVTPGVATINFDNFQVGYVFGYVGGKTSKSGKVGFVGGQRIKPNVDLIAGMNKALKAVKSDGEVLVTYTNDWDDVAKAKEAALAQFGQGADAVVAYLDNGFGGVVQAAKEKRKWALSPFFDLGKREPEVNLVSAVADPAAAVTESVRLAVEKKLEPKDYVYGIGTPVVQLGTLNPSVPADVKSGLDKVVADLKAGTIKP